MLLRKDPMLDEIKNRILSSFPEADVSVLDSSRDHAGGMLYVTNVPSSFDEEFERVMEFVMVPLKNSKKRSEYIVVPIAHPEDLL